VYDPVVTGLELDKSPELAGAVAGVEVFAGAEYTGAGAGAGAGGVYDEISEPGLKEERAVAIYGILLKLTVSIIRFS
jgi:hypothetical protein